MDDLQEQVDYWLTRMAGPDANSAWHGLVELGPAALDEIRIAFAATLDRQLRRALLTVIVELRQPASAAFFGSLLRDDDTVIWRSALDGLVTLGTDEAARILESARTTADEERRRWIEEALGQLRNGPFSAPSGGG